MLPSNATASVSAMLSAIVLGITVMPTRPIPAFRATIFTSGTLCKAKTSSRVRPQNSIRSEKRSKLRLFTVAIRKGAVHVMEFPPNHHILLSDTCGKA